jgi:hypothetical protein
MVPRWSKKMRTLTDNMGNQWEVIEAESDAEAWNAINHARCSGSTGSTFTVIENGVERVTASVRRVPAFTEQA